MEWCEHIKWTEAIGGSSGWIIYDSMKCRIPDSWNICPIEGCHVPRPKEQKKLAEILKKSTEWNSSIRSLKPFSEDFNINHSKLAQAAIEAVIKVYEEWFVNKHQEIDFQDYLKEKLL